MRRIVSVVFCLGVATCGFSVEDLLKPSVIAFHMTGEITADDICSLSCEVSLGEDDSPAINLKAFRMVRTADDGETIETRIEPKLSPKQGGTPNQRVFNWSDQTIAKGVTYRYYATYEADVYLSTCPVVLTVTNQVSDMSKAGNKDELRVQVLGPTYVISENVFLVRARPSKPGAILSWRALEPNLSQLLAQYNGTAAIRAPKVIGGAVFEIKAVFGNETATTYYSPDIINISVVGVVSKGWWHDPKIIAEAQKRKANIEDARAGTETGKARIRALLTEKYAPEKPYYYSAEGFLNETTTFLEAVGTTAIPLIAEHFDSQTDTGVRYALLTLMCKIDISFVLSRYGSSLINASEFSLTVLLLQKLATSKIQSEKAMKFIEQALKHSTPYVRLTATQTLGNFKQAGTDALLKNARLHDADPEVRFQAACALQWQRTGKEPDIPEIPPFVSETITSESVALASQLYPLVINELEITDLPEPMPINIPDDANLGHLVTPESAIAKLLVLGESVLPIVNRRFLESHISSKERELLLWLLALAHIPLPKPIETRFVDEFFTAKGTARKVALENFGRLYRNTVRRDKSTEMIDPVGLSPRERLICLLLVSAFLKSDNDLEILRTTQVEKMPIPPEHGMNAIDYNRALLAYRCWQLLRLQQGEDAVAEYAREIYPVKAVPAIIPGTDNSIPGTRY